MKKRISFKIKIFAIITIAIGLISIIGLLAYTRFTNIISEISSEARPDMRLVAAKSLMNDISAAENNVKSFSLTKDTTYLREFYISATIAEDKLIALHKMNINGGITKAMVDSLDTLISKKFRILGHFIELQDQFRVEEVLDKLSHKIEKSIEKENSDEVANKKKLLAWLFNRQKRKDSIKKKLLTNEVKLDIVNSEVEKIREEEKGIESELKEKELELLILENKITSRIKTLINEMEAAEMKNIALQTKKAEKAVEETNIQIALFCIATAIVLIIMSLTIINYIRFNNRYRRAMKKAKLEVESLARTKEKFFANMSHEIRTPMNAIAGFTEQLLQSPINTEQREQLTIVKNSIHHLLYLINDVLDFSKLQAGKIRLESIDFNYKELINDVAGFIQPLMREKNLSFSLKLDDKDNTIVLGDPFRLRQILLNLLANAIKFTENGSIRLEVTTVNDLEDKEKILLQIKVIDTGIGMNKQQMERVFKEFEQGDNSISRNYGGSGLGLYIVKRLVKLHQGKVEIESRVQNGTVVTIEIPYIIGNAENLVSHEATSSTNISNLNGLNVLIVDDEEYNRKLLISIFKKHHVVYEEATNGNQALAMVEKGDFDLVLMDTRMPKCSGPEAAKKIRALLSNKNSIPIIAVTAAVSEEDKREYESAMIDGFLSKPFSEQELLVEISKVLKHGAVEKIVSDWKENESAEGSISFNSLKEISNGDLVFYKEMLITFLNSTMSGIQEMEEELKKENWTLLADLAHRLASPCRHLCALELHRLLKKMETSCRKNEELDTINELVKLAKLDFNKIRIITEKELERLEMDQKI